MVQIIAIICVNVDQDVCHHIATLRNNELCYYGIIIIIQTPSLVRQSFIINATPVI